MVTALQSEKEDRILVISSSYEFIQRVEKTLSDRLQDHYENKYSDQRAVGPTLVKLTRSPAGRTEAAVHYLIKHVKGGSVLEIGGGDGTLARSLLAASLKFERYVLTDLSPTRASVATRSLADDRFIGFPLNIEEGGHTLEDGSFDTVILVALIEHLIDPIRAMQNVHRKLRPGGFAYVDTPNIAKFTRRAKLLFGRFPSTASRNEGLETYGGKSVDLYDEGHLHYWTFRSMTLMLTQYCGFSRVERAPYWSEGAGSGNTLKHGLAQLSPTLFSDVAVIAYK